MHKKVRILAVSQNYWPEPFNIHEICKGLVERGHDVTVLAGIPNYPEGVVPNEYKRGKNRKQHVDGVDINRVATVPRGKNLKGINVAKRALNYFSFAASGKYAARSLVDFDIVVAFQMSPLFMVEPAIDVARRNNLPLVMYVLDLWPEDLMTGDVSRESVLFKAVKHYSAKAYAKADSLAVTSPHFADYLRDYLRVKTNHVAWLPQYAETIFEEIGKETADKTSHEYLEIVFAGNVGGNQSLESAVTAMAMLPEEFKSRLHVYGAGSHLEACRNLAMNLKVEKRVLFHGRKPLEDMPTIYKNADAMLLTLAKPQNGSLVPVYTIPRKLQSYMAAGKPIIACANGAASEVVQNAGCGVTCEGEDAEALALAICRLEQKSAEELQALGNNARNYYMKTFSRDLFFGRLEGLLEGAVQ